MKKKLVIYNSQTGFTQKYAKWIAEDLSCDCISFENKNQVNLNDYDTIIFGSWFHAGRILKIKWLLDECAAHPEKRYLAFATGASPMNSSDIKTAMESNIPADSPVKGFYFTGGLSYENMKLPPKIMMKLFASMVNSKKDKTPEEEEMAKMIGYSYDFSSRNFITPLVEAARS